MWKYIQNGWVCLHVEINKFHQVQNYVSSPALATQGANGLIWKQVWCKTSKYTEQFSLPLWDESKFTQHMFTETLLVFTNG